MDWTDIPMWGVYALAAYGSYRAVRGIASKGRDQVHSNSIGRIYLRGVIKDQASGRGPFSQGKEITTDVVQKRVDEAAADNVKGIIFDIHSPGGSPVASDEIGSIIKGLEIPTVARVRGMAASGGYWIAASCDHIVANRNSMVGSIGVIASHTSIEGFLEMWGFENTTFKAGKYKDMFSPFRKPTTEEIKMFEADMKELHDDFKNTVAEYRGIPREKVDDVAEGLIYSGKKGLEYKLIDQLGRDGEAKAFIEGKAGITNAKIVDYKAKKRFSLPDLMSASVYEMGHYFASGMSDSIKATVSEEMKKGKHPTLE